LTISFPEFSFNTEALRTLRTNGERRERTVDLIEGELTDLIIGAAIEVHKALGPGLLESVYEPCLCRELQLRGLRFERQLDIPAEYKGVKLGCGYRLDILVEGKVIVEVKSVETLLPVHEAQLLTYLRLVGKRVGLLINFNVPVLKKGIIRRVL
jgi:GxxExxY protein